ncbi:protein of unknown function [Burkholderia multivorans]
MCRPRPNLTLVDRNRKAVARETARDRRTDAAGGARHEGNTGMVVCVHRNLLIGGKLNRMMIDVRSGIVSGVFASLFHLL